jgi:hypothetical protein
MRSKLRHLGRHAGPKNQRLPSASSKLILTLLEFKNKWRGSRWRIHTWKPRVRRHRTMVGTLTSRLEGIGKSPPPLTVATTCKFCNKKSNKRNRASAKGMSTRQSPPKQSAGGQYSCKEQQQYLSWGEQQ